MRRICSAGAGIVVLAAIGMGAGPAVAQADPPASCLANTATCLSVTPGSDSLLAARGDTVQLDYQVQVTGGSVTSATLTAHQDANLKADPSSVTIDGTSVPATAAGNDLTVELGSKLPLDDGNGVDVSFTATVDETVDADMISSASVTFDDAAHRGPATATSTNVAVQLERPDLFVQADTSPVLVPHGASLSSIRGTNQILGASIGDNGGLEVPATLSLDFSGGFLLGQAGVFLDNGTLACSQSGSSWSCPLTVAQLDGVLTVDVAATAAAAPGTKGGVRLTVTPDGITDATPADNTVDVPLQVAGLADLSVRMSPSTATVAQNGSVVVTTTITNAGPDPATGLGALIRFSARDGSKRSDFRVADVGGATWAPDLIFQTWTVANPLPAGGSVSHSWRITGLTRGANVWLIATLFSTSFDPHVTCSGFGCETGTHAAISVGAPATVHTTGSASTTPTEESSGGGELAATGLPGGDLIGAALALVAVGLLLCGAGYRRRASRR